MDVSHGLWLFFYEPGLPKESLLHTSGLHVEYWTLVQRGFSFSQMYPRPKVTNTDEYPELGWFFWCCADTSDTTVLKVFKVWWFWRGFILVHQPLSNRWQTVQTSRWNLGHCGAWSPFMSSTWSILIAHPTPWWYRKDSVPQQYVGYGNIGRFIKHHIYEPWDQLPWNGSQQTKSHLTTRLASLHGELARLASPMSAQVLNFRDRRYMFKRRVTKLRSSCFSDPGITWFQCFQIHPEGAYSLTSNLITPFFKQFKTCLHNVYMVDLKVTLC